MPAVCVCMYVYGCIGDASIIAFDLIALSGARPGAVAHHRSATARGGMNRALSRATRSRRCRGLMHLFVGGIASALLPLSPPSVRSPSTFRRSLLRRRGFRFALFRGAALSRFQKRFYDLHPTRPRERRYARPDISVSPLSSFFGLDGASE